MFSDISPIIQLFNAHQIVYWLIGGKAIDLFLGFESRPHKDVDFFVLDTSFSRCLTVLKEAGYKHLPRANAAEGAVFQKDAVLVDITRIQLAPDGSSHTFGIYEPIRWPDQFLERHVIQIGNLPCHTLTLANHLAMKQIVANWYANGRLRLEDLQDIQQLTAQGHIS